MTITVDDGIDNRSVPCDGSGWTGPRAPPPYFRASPGNGTGTNNMMHGKEDGGNEDKEENNVPVTSDASSGGQKSAWTLMTTPMVHTFTVAPAWQPGPVGPTEKDNVVGGKEQTTINQLAGGGE